MRVIYITTIFITSILVGCNDQKTSNIDVKPTSEQDLNEDKLSDDKLMDLVQRQTFNYFWEGAETNSGMARERIHLDNIYPQNDQNIVTAGGTGFGLMAIIVGIERGFITRNEGFEHFKKVVGFLEKADRFHGAWSHWIDGETGKVKPFSAKDNGGDLVETAFLIQGLIAVAEYFKDGNQEEKELVNRINTLWETVEWNWYTKGEEVLYWHWSPNYEWEMNFPVGGYNECLIMYVLAAASPTHPINKEVYEKGWAKNGTISNGTVYYGLDTELNHYEHDNDPVGPLFWAHYSYLGLNPKGLIDQFGDYWKLNENHAKIHYKYCIDNPLDFKGYGPNNWGLTSSYSMEGYSSHRPGKDLGVISPTAALSSFPYTPKESMQLLRHMYEKQSNLIGKYGPYDAFSLENDWHLPRYLAIDQGPIPVMIENYRTQLIWNLFMKNEDVQNGLNKLGFNYAR